MNNFPLVSIVITNYNREKTVGKAIESALLQDYPNLEIIISDNCSTDNSHQVISKYINDNRVKYYRNEENIGMLGNFKACFEERAKGEWITIVNSDDEYVNPKFISQSIDLVNKYENVSIVKSESVFKFENYSKNERLSNFNDFYEGGIFLSFFNFNTDFGWAGILLKLDKINKLKIFDKNVIASDYIANFKLLVNGNICFNKNISYQFNVHSNNISHINYNSNQIPNVINELNDFFSSCVHLKLYNSIYNNFSFYYIKSIFQSIYIYNRNSLSTYIPILRELNSNEYQKFYENSFMFRTLYYFPKIGKIIVNIKKKVLPKASL